MSAILHASCAARGSVGVLIRGQPGAGKSSLLLRLLDRGFDLVADDYVLLDDAVARAPDRLRGLLEVRGLGVYRLPFRPSASVRLVVEAGEPGGRIAERRLCRLTAAPAITLDLLSARSAGVVALAVDCLEGRVEEVAGPFATGAAGG